QALVGFHGRQLPGEPTTHLRAGIAAHERLEAEPCAQLVPQGLTTAVIDPRVDLRGREAERNVAKVRERRGATRPGDFRGVVHVGKAGRHRIERFERADQLTGCEDLDVQPATGERRDRLRDTLGAGLEARQGLGPDRDHLELARALRDRGRRKGRCRGRGPEAGARNELAAIHVSLPVSRQACLYLSGTGIFSRTAGVPATRIERSTTYTPAAARASEAAKRLCMKSRPDAARYKSHAVSNINLYHALSSES